MLKRSLFLMTSVLALSACGLLDPQAQKGIVYGAEDLGPSKSDLAAQARIEAGIALIQRGVSERDPSASEKYIAIGERLLQ